jgi:2-amino-4-hydroxy-6-hydroxymethyldihydropteridine diphosphokinase
VRAYIALGSNLGDREQHLRQAIDAIDERIDTSSVWETDPVGGPDGQGAFLNMVVALETDKTPRELLELCRALEAGAGRVRTEHWGPRTLDADVLLVGDLVVDDPDLTVPHPLWRERAFVVEPLREVADAALAASLPSLDTSGVRRIGSLSGDSGTATGMSTNPSDLTSDGVLSNEVEDEDWVPEDEPRVSEGAPSDAEPVDEPDAPPEAHPA